MERLIGWPYPQASDEGPPLAVFICLLGGAFCEESSAQLLCDLVATLLCCCISVCSQFPYVGSGYALLRVGGSLR